MDGQMARIGVGDVATAGAFRSVGTTEFLL